jgi:uncharacterized protein YjbI with pentapeptide repeats
MINGISVGTKITEGRKKKGLSQAQFAELVGVSPQAVSKWERGDSLPDIVMLSSIAGIFGTDLNYFAVSEAEADETDSAESADSGGARASDDCREDDKRSFEMSLSAWKDADFSGLRNTHGKFNFSNITNCNFTGSDLSNTVLRGNNISGCNFDNAALREVRFSMSVVKQNTFKLSDLKGAKVTGSNISRCDFSGADLSKADFKTSILGSCNLSGAVFSETFFKKVAFRDLVFEGEMNDCSISGCLFKQTEFRGVTFKNCLFKNLNLKKAVFTGCKADSFSYSLLAASNADMAGVEKI